MFTPEEYERGDAICISWHIADVKGIDPSLTDAQAREVLARFNNHHEGSMEAMWEDLKYHISDYKLESEVNKEINREEKEEG